MEAPFGGLNPTQKSLFMTLYLRAVDARSADPILGDTWSAEIVDTIGHDFPVQRVLPSLVANVALRSKRLDELIGSFVARHPDAVVVELGCGLDPRIARCDPGPAVGWYDVDFPEVLAIRERFLPGASHPVGTDLTVPGWLARVPRDRPAIVVADGLMAFLSGDAYRSLTRALTAHFSTGEFVFSTYTPFLMRAGTRIGSFMTLGAKPAGDGIDDPRAPQSWGARLTLVEELLFTRRYARNRRISRNGNWLIRYRF